MIICYQKEKKRNKRSKKYYMAKKISLVCPINTKEYQVLSKEEERRILVTHHYSCDEEVKQQCVDLLVYHNMGMVYKMVLDITNKDDRMDPNGLISYAVEGLIIAINKFDLNNDVKFVTYAHDWILKKIILGCHENTMIRLPEYVYDNLNKFGKKRVELTRKLGREPTYKPYSVDAIDEYERNKYMSELEEVLVYGEHPAMTASVYKTVCEAWETQNLYSLNTMIDNGDGDKPCELMDTIEDKSIEKRNREDEARAAIKDEFKKLRVHFNSIKEGQGDLIYKIWQAKLSQKTSTTIAKELGLKREEERALEGKGREYLQNSPALMAIFESM